jgi:RND family efflux transporter MFP subunit
MSHEKAALDSLRIDRSKAPKGQGRSWLIPTLLAVALAGAAIWWGQQPKAPAVETMLVQGQAASSAGGRTLLNASGYVTARRAATVSSKVTGKVMEVNVEEGMKVEAGQVLARLDASNIETGLRLAEARLDAAKKALEETKPNLVFAERELKRFTELATTKVVSDSDLRRAEMEARVLSGRLIRQTSDIDVAEKELAQWRQQLDDMTIRAPFGGIVTSKNAQPGEMISPMSVGGFTRTGICTIVDMSSLEVEVDVNESYINRVQSGLPALAILDAYPDWKIPSKVIAIIPTADRQKATVKVRVGFDQLDPRILPDMGVKVAFQGGDSAPQKASIVLIPKSALVRSGERDIVWVVNDSRVERRAVTVEQAIGEQCTISAGLNPGERIVTKAPEGLADGARISEKKS